MQAYAPRPYRVMLPSATSLSGLRGMGQPTASATATAGNVAKGLSIATPLITTGAAVAAASSLAAGGSGLILGMTASLAVPIIGAALAAVTAIVTLLIENSGCGETCIETSQWANQAEPALLANIQAYFNLPAPRTISQQNAALSNFIAVWTTLENQCSQSGLGTAGQKCISDRQSGACTWKQTATSPLLAYVQYGEPNVGECWNWYSGYHDPIANDQVVDDDPAAVAQVQANAAAGTSSSSTIAGMSTSTLLLLGAGLVAVLALGGGN
jgi:hypothetical protein